MTPPPTMTTFASVGRDRLDSIVGFVNSRGFPASFFPIPTVFGEPIRAEAPHVVGSLAVENRLVNQPSNARRAANAVRIAASRHDKTGNPTTFSYDEASVGREGWPTSPHASFLDATG